MIGAKTKKARRGFTIVEAVIVLSIFPLLFVTITDLFSVSNRSGQAVVLRSKLEADERTALEEIARAVRASNLDYTAYGGVLPAQPMNSLLLMSPTTGDVSRVGVGTQDTDCFNDGKSFPCLRVSTDGGNTWTPLSPRGSKIDVIGGNGVACDFCVYASPARDPFAFDPASGTFTNDIANGTSLQPIVTIKIRFHGLAAHSYDDWYYNLQTTVTPRLYLR